MQMLANGLAKDDIPLNFSLSIIFLFTDQSGNDEITPTCQTAVQFVTLNIAA